MSSVSDPQLSTGWPMPQSLLRAAVTETSAQAGASKNRRERNRSVSCILVTPSVTFGRR
jgi:hypothetical protein